jgi:hypothetical protein
MRRRTSVGGGAEADGSGLGRVGVRAWRGHTHKREVNGWWRVQGCRARGRECFWSGSLAQNRGMRGGEGAERARAEGGRRTLARVGKLETRVGVVASRCHPLRLGSCRGEGAETS